MVINVELTESEEEALAQFLKRIGWQDWRANSVDDAEAQLMRAACEKLRASLNNSMGYAPR